MFFFLCCCCCCCCRCSGVSYSVEHFQRFPCMDFFFYLLLSFFLSVDSANSVHVQCSAFVHIRLLSSDKEAEQNLLRILLWFCRTIYVSHIRNAHIANAPISFRQWCKHIWLFSLSTINLDTLFFLHKWTDFEAYTTLSRICQPQPTNRKQIKMSKKVEINFVKLSFLNRVLHRFLIEINDLWSRIRVV